jgi:Ca2+-transporting ATPase
VGQGAARALAFVTLITGNLALILANRSHGLGLVAGLRVRNLRLWAMAGSITGLLALVLYQPVLCRLFYFEPPAPLPLVQALAWGLCSLVWFEGLKAIRSRLAAKNDC